MHNDCFEAYAERLHEFIEETTRPTTPTANTGTPSYEDRFDTLALDLFALQFTHLPPYRKLGEHLGLTPGAVRTWSEIPCVPTAAFKEFALSSLDEEDRSVVFRSSGTTAQTPSQHFHDARSLVTYERSLLPWFRHHLLPDQAPVRILSLLPPAEAAPHSSLVHMLATVTQDIGTSESLCFGTVLPDGSWHLPPDTTLNALTQAATGQEPLLLAGTAYSFVNLLDAMRSQQLTLKLPPGSRLMETGGYKGRSRTFTKQQLHRALSRQLSLPETHIVTEYGMTELSSQAYDNCVGRDAPRRLRFPPWCRALVLRPTDATPAEPGQTGLLQVVDLANTRSVLALQTKDLAIAYPDGFEYAGRATAAEARGCSLMQA